MAIKNPIMTDSKWCCVICLNPFSHRSGLRRHVMSVHGNTIRPFDCKSCGKMFKRKDHLTCHMKKIHPADYEVYQAQRRAQAGGVATDDDFNFTVDEQGHIQIDVDEGYL